MMKISHLNYVQKAILVLTLIFTSPGFSQQSKNEIMIDMVADWKLKIGEYASSSLSAEGWTPLASLPFKKVIETFNYGDAPLKITTGCKIFEISKSDDELLDQDAVSIHIPFATRVSKLFFNGKQIASEGHVSGDQIVSSGFIRNYMKILPRNLFKIGNNEICITLYSYQEDEHDIYTSVNDIPARITYHSTNLNDISERATLMLDFLYLGFGFYHLLLFIKRPKELYNLFFSLFSISLSAYIYSRSQAIYETGFDPYTLTRFEYIMVFQLVPTSTMFFQNLFTGKISKITLVYSCFAALLSILMLIVDYGLSGKILMIWQLSILPMFGYLIYIFVIAIRAKNFDSYRLVLGFLILAACSVVDLSAAMIGGGKNLGIMKYGFFTFVMGIAVVLANRFLRVYKEVEVLNGNLEKKVEERTKELQNTLSEVQLLKEQQDGDYFLTSLLINPLGTNRVKSSSIKVEFFSKQKKVFEFKGRKHEIGGDINIADSLTLRDRHYTVFVNGDAMGKSIQGAGGALVLGVVFQSVVNRTKIRKQDQFKSPERWLKECFLELHSVFESFDGSMLISVVMGIIDDQSGLVYYINAEHPWTVLYRDNIASFIENDLELRKIGTVGMDGDIRIKTLSLEPSDILFLGSDGRDDLVTSNDGNTRMINEDETQFLRRVEEGKGKVQDIVQGIKNYGEITDDLSLMKIEFQPVGPYPHKDPSDKKNRMEKIYSLYKEKKYSTVVEMAESFIHEYPEEIEVFHYAATAYKLLKNYNRAADLGEILKMRMPTHIDNLVNLSDNYRIMGNVDRARKILVKLEKYDTANKYLDEIRNKLSEVGGNPIFVG